MLDPVNGLHANEYIIASHTLDAGSSPMQEKLSRPGSNTEVKDNFYRKPFHSRRVSEAHAFDSPRD
jgi:hypothetical protein